VSLYTDWGDKVSYSELQLVAMLKGNPVDSVIFKDEPKTSAQALADLKDPKTVGTYIVVLVENGQLKPSSNPKLHSSLLDAQKEAERLASTNPGLKFCVLQDCGTVQAVGVQWSYPVDL
jgi:hypothetical protein